jgi:hypothetical protein
MNPKVQDDALEVRGRLLRQSLQPDELEQPPMETRSVPERKSASAVRSSMISQKWSVWPEWAQMMAAHSDRIDEAQAAGDSATAHTRCGARHGNVTASNGDHVDEAFRQETELAAHMNDLKAGREPNWPSSVHHWQTSCRWETARRRRECGGICVRDALDESSGLLVMMANCPCAHESGVGWTAH